MKRFGAVLILIVALLPHQSIPANAGVADCLSFGYPSVSSTSSTINVSVSVKVNCTKEQIRSASGAVLSIVEEGSFGPTCSGLYFLTPGGFQTISCSIPLTGGFASARKGATTSTIKVWFAWDFSTKFITFQHAAIPSKSSTGGSTSGSTGGSATLSCTSAPNKPVLIWLQQSDGITFSSSASSLGDRPTALYYSFSYFDGAKNSWDAWSSWLSGIPTSTISYRAMTGNNKTKIAFAVYGANGCGSSAQARESDDQKGLYLIPSLDPVVANAAAELADAINASSDAIKVAKSAVSQFFEERSKCVSSYSKMDLDTLTKFSSFCLNLDNEYVALYQKIYGFNNINFTTTDQANNGVDVANTYAEEADILVAKMKDLTTVLTEAVYKASLPKKKTITCVKGKLTKKVTAIKPKCTKGYKVKK